MRERLASRWPGGRRGLIGTLGVGVLILAVVALSVSGTIPVSVQTATAPSAAQPPSASSPIVDAPPLPTDAAPAEPTDSAADSPFAAIAEPPPQPPERTAPIQHTVAPGDVLWQIAEQYRLRPETLLWTNDISDPDLLLVGQTLLIPPVDGVLYTVRAGDSVALVAERYGLDPQAVVRANNLADADQIVAGTDIFLPGGRPLAAVPRTTDTTDQTVQPADGGDLATAVSGAAVALPENIDALLSAGWLQSQHAADLFKSADVTSPRLHEVPGAVRLERLDGFRNGRIQVRDPGDGRTRQAMTGWINARDVDVGRAPATRELPRAYPQDTAMDIAHVFAPYRTQLDGSPYAEANCGPTALGMALEAFGVSVPSRQIRAAVLDAQHMYGNGVGTLITALARVVEQQGLSALDLREADGSLHHWALDDLRAHIASGHPVIVQVRYRSLPGRGGVAYFGDHYILVTGAVGDSFLYNDPIDFDGLGWDRIISGPALRTAMNASDQRYAYSAVAIGR